MKWMSIHKKRFKNYFIKTHKGKDFKVNILRTSIVEFKIGEQTINYHAITILLTQTKVWITKNGIRLHSRRNAMLFLEDEPFKDIISEVKTKKIIDRL